MTTDRTSDGRRRTRRPHKAGVTRAAAVGVTASATVGLMTGMSLSSPATVVPEASPPDLGSTEQVDAPEVAVPEAPQVVVIRRHHVLPAPSDSTARQSTPSAPTPDPAATPATRSVPTPSVAPAPRPDPAPAPAPDVRTRGSR